MPKTKRTKEIYTHTGHPLTVNEDIFIDKYLELGNGRQAVIDAGYKSKTPEAYANMLLRKDYIHAEIVHRRQQIHDKSIADSKEVMNYFTSVMRGEIKDQFGLEAPLSERTKAAQELAKRTIDIDNRRNGEADTKVEISLNWKRQLLTFCHTIPSIGFIPKHTSLSR